MLVTGGCGFLGSVLVPMLLERGDTVTVVDTMIFGSHLPDHPNLTVLRQDFVDADPSGHDTVMHLASFSNDPWCDLDPTASIDNNITKTKSFAARCVDAGVRRFIFASSASVYGSSGSDLLLESSPTGPVTLYALTKLQSETDLVGLPDPLAQMRVTRLRLASLFGLSPRIRFDLVINGMIRNALLGRPLIVNGGDQYRCFVHVKDAARAFIAAQDFPGDVFNVGANYLNFTIAALAEEIARLTGGSVLIRSNMSDVRSYQLDFTRISLRTVWRAHQTITDAVKEITEARIPDMDSPSYTNMGCLVG